MAELMKWTQVVNKFSTLSLEEKYYLNRGHLLSGHSKIKIITSCSLKP
jgi:hypothetical protein